MTSTLGPTDRLVTEALANSGQFGFAYQNVANSLPDGSPEKTWFSNAAMINAGVGMPATFASVQTTVGYAISGVTAVDPQVISDGIAQAVLGSIVTGLPVDIERIREVEGNLVIEKYGLPEHLWTFANPITSYMLVGDFRFVSVSTPEELDQLLATTAVSGLAALIDEAIAIDNWWNGEWDFEENAEAAIEAVRQQILDARRYGHDFNALVDAVRSKVPGALSFLAAGRDLIDNPYGPATPQIGGIDHAALAVLLYDIRHDPRSPHYEGPYDPLKDPTNTELLEPWNQSSSTSPITNRSPLDDPSNPLTGQNRSIGTPAGTRHVGGAGSGPGNFDHGEGGDNGNQGGKGKTGGQVGNGGVGSSNNPADHQGPTATSSGGTAFNGNAGVAGYQNDRSTVSTTTKTFGHIPILLDLDGNGIKITELQRSQKFVDAEGEGFHNRTAWAGAGDAVLFFDDNNSNKIDEKKEFIFSEWDPSATSDMEALRSYFDSDGDGWLTSADAKFAQFKLEIANADGSATVQTLAQAGIASINLKADTTHIVLPDGSVITGQSSFTRTDNTTGTVANTTLAYDADGNKVEQTVTFNATGHRVVDTVAKTLAGGIAFAYKSVTSPNGNSITNSYDDNGDGIHDRLQTIVKVTNGDGTKTETLTNKVGNASGANRRLTVASRHGEVRSRQLRKLNITWLRGANAGRAVA
jgi:hypothetical protein